MTFVTNPYKNYKPVADPTLFCGRRDLLSLIAENIRHWQMCAVAGEPKVGKTSLLYYLVHPQGAWLAPEFREHLNNSDHYLCVLIELGLLPTNDANGFFRYLFDRVVEEARKSAKDRGENESSLAPVQKPGDAYETQQLFEQYLKHLEQRVILLFDDFDIIAHDMHNEDIVKIMQKIGALTQAIDLQDKLNCIFVSVDSLGQLFKSKGLTINSLLSKIVLDNGFLRPMNDEEIEQLITKPLRLVEDESISFMPEEIDFIKQVAGHHPAMIKAACSHFFDAKSKKTLLSLSQLRRELDKDQHVQTLMDTQWEWVVQSEQQTESPLTACLVAVAQQKPLKEPAALEILHNKGLIDKSAPDPWIWGDTFRRFILGKWAGIPQNTAFSGPSKNGLTSRAGYDLQGVSLAPLENKLFTYLAQNVEHTCERTELHQILWGDKPPRSRDALEQLIKRIREKIEPHPDYPEHLLTVRGQGYLLRANNTE